MTLNNGPRSALTILVTLSILLGLIVLIEGIYLFTLGGWPLMEDGRWSHGLVRRMSSFSLLVHSVIFYLIAIRSRRPRWGTVILYPLSLVLTSFVSLVGLEGARKEGGGISFLVVAIVVPLLIAFVTTTNKPEVAASAGQ